MRCRTFKSQIMDWKSDKLNAGQSQRIADHLRTCAFCAQEARAEASLQELWRTAGPLPTRDLWPQIATRLEGQSIKRPAISVRPPQWALVSAFCLAVVAVCGLSLGPKELAPPSHSSGITRPASPSQAAAGPGAPVWNDFSDVSRVNPVVDDPAGTSMENVWTHINSGDNAKAEDQ
jgi:hypothetical protein